ncbi:oligosaccharide flippase family protein [Niabella sp.]|uniref:lipopolysaccharide biosynthesis protein n=1 Tax=Niabella sp. TaxID=1962976 RepID=UPI002602D442|nr:oligosaccharide flippase family protein [Niabella sp.]
MSDSLNIFKSSVVYAIGNFGSKILSLALVSLFSYYLTKSEYGIYDLIITGITFLVPVVTLQIGDAVYRNLFEITGAEERSEIISSAFGYVLVSIIICAILFLIISVFVPFAFITEFLLLLFFSCMLPFLLQVTRGLGKKQLYATVGIANTVALLSLCLVFLVLFKKGIYGLLIASILANCFACLLLLFKGGLLRYISFSKTKKQVVVELLKYSWPLVPNTISWFLITMSDRFIILYWLNMDANGIFAVSTKYPSLIMMVNSVFILAVQDHALDEKSGFNSRFFNTYIRFDFTLINIFILITPLLTRFTLSKEFYEAWKYMPLLYMSTAFMAFSSYIGAYYLKFRDTKGLFYTTIVGGIINILVSGGMMPFIGLYAPALGSLLSFLVMYIIRYRYISKKFEVRINNKEILLLFAASVACMAILFLNNTTGTYSLLVISLLLFFIYNKELLRYLYNNSKKLIIKK